ncbi:unnamed protein product [Ambrosiozyma monospora]|uniref:Unnamed protein product n=1 Tax=Ambrosiozyma monospora TaxID=43982 RepID=A0ACB5TX17_AMBMO|nr:unnamed protein product [Ambrosiozyma monospora]
MGYFKKLMKLWFVPTPVRAENVQAPNQFPSADDCSSMNESIAKKLSDVEEETEDVNSLGDATVKLNPRKKMKHEPPMDYLIRVCSLWAGSIHSFITLWIVMIAWIVYGIVSNAADTWQIVMQDGQSIQTYFWDTLLMRQQLDDSHKFLKLFGTIKSRSSTHQKLLIKMKNYQRNTLHLSNDEIRAYLAEQHINFDVGSKIDLKDESWFDKMCSLFARWLGSLLCVIVYWILIFVWIGCGKFRMDTGDTDDYGNDKYETFSDSWQMIVNTGTAVVLLISSVLLQNVRVRNDKFCQE